MPFKTLLIKTIWIRNEFRVVGFEVEAHSIDFDQLQFDGNTCKIPTEHSLQYVNPKGTRILFLYSIEWKESDVSWASRWDIYLGMSDVEIHWFSIINSLVVVCFLSGKIGECLFLYILFEASEIIYQYFRNFDNDYRQNIT